jgi:Tol biopolymer transport system component/imidazolonepropionase-like amidohydrolase
MAVRPALFIGTLALLLVAPAPPEAGRPAPSPRLGAESGMSPTLGSRPVSPSTPVTDFEVTLTEGTNMAADLSPDGSTIVTDLVGRLWTLPAEGGGATPITDPFGDARQPQWSPDGRRVVFQAYWAGDYDVWVVNRDGSGLEQLTVGPFDDREPSWSPDGTRVVFSSDRGGSYDIWEVIVEGNDVRRLTTDSGNEYTPSVSPDGTRIAFVSGGANAAVWVGSRTSEPRSVVSLDGATGYSPVWSPDGSSLAYVRIGNGTSGLYVTPIEGASEPGARISADDEDVFPFRASWTAEGRLLYTGDGHVRTVAEQGGARTDISFTATVTLDRPTYRKALRGFDYDGSHPVRGIVSPALSPDGNSVLFAALGDLWTMVIGAPAVRLTDDAYVEVDPAWSPDGSQIVYASDREGDTDLYLRDVSSGSERRLTTGGGSMPAWSPDGSEIAFSGGQGRNTLVQIMSLASGAVRTVRTGLNSPGRPTWSPDGRSIAVSALWTYSTRFREGVNRALLIPAVQVISEQGEVEQEEVEQGEVATATAGRHDSDGLAGDVWPMRTTEVQVGERWLDFGPHGSFASRGTDGPIWSPDGRMMAYVASAVLWVVTVSPEGDPVGPARRLNNERSSDPSWSGDSRSILYLTTNRLRRVSLRSGEIEDVDVPLTWARTPPTDRYVVHAGQLFDGASSRLRRNVDVVIAGNRIARVTEHDDRWHGGRVVDASDGILSPGLIEMHMHGGLGAGEKVGRQWLSFGVTTVRSPSADPFEMTEVRESSAIGRRLEPRMFGTGNTIDGSRVYYAGAPALTSSGQVELELGQARDLGFDVVKTYVRLPDAVQRRVIAEAHALGVPVTSHELYPAVAYGADGVEHVKGTSRRGYSTKVSELSRSYQDVVELLARSGMTLTPTIGIYGSYALLAEEDPSMFDDPRVEEFIPGAPDAARRGGDLDTRRRLVRDMASLARRLVEQGGTVVVGTDSPIIPQGLSLVAEMQALVEYGGMSEIDVWRAATSIPAAAMGYGAEFGSIREGMLADLIVLGSDPLNDIRGIRDVRIVIKDGRVHTLDELLQRPVR